MVLVVTAETSEDRRRRPELNPTPSVFLSDREGDVGSESPVWSELGRVAEWLKAHDWKSCGLIPAWVRIPPRPLEEVGSSRGARNVIRIAVREVTAETTEDRRRRPQVNPTPSVWEYDLSCIISPHVFPRERFLGGDVRNSGRGSVR